MSEYKISIVGNTLSYRGRVLTKHDDTIECCNKIDSTFKNIYDNITNLVQDVSTIIVSEFEYYISITVTDTTNIILKLSDDVDKSYKISIKNIIRNIDDNQLKKLIDYLIILNNPQKSTIDYIESIKE